MAEKPAKKEPYKYIGSEIWEQGHPTGRYQFQDNPKWMFTGSSVRYDSKDAAEAAWQAFSSAWDNCSKNAEMIKYCTEVELTVAAAYGMIKGIEESYGFTNGNLQSAINQTTEKKSLDEENLEYVNSQISDLMEAFSSELESTISPAVESMDTINSNIGTVGDELTKYHKNLYSTYKSCCNNVGEKIQNFYAEAES